MPRPTHSGLAAEYYARQTSFQAALERLREHTEATRVLREQHLEAEHREAVKILNEIHDQVIQLRENRDRVWEELHRGH